MTRSKKRAHLIGICGAGMSALALLLKESGWQITGSDNNFYEPISGHLKKNKISFFKKYNAGNIPKNVDLIVIGKHADLTREANEEVKQAFKMNVEKKSLPEMLAGLAKNKKNLVVAGSFGKSTCTAFIAWCLLKTKKDPSYFIGAVPINFNKSSHMGKGKEFVLEGDEYPSSNWDKKSKFLHLVPSSILLTSVEHDHKNIFKTEKSYKEPYKKLVARIQRGGLLVYSLGAKNTKEVVKYAKCKTVSYALTNKGAHWYAQNIKYGVETSFDLIHKGKRIINIKTKLLGKHNIENIIGAGALVLENKIISPVDFAKTVKSFQGIKRRIELLTRKSSVLVYEGFGSSYAKAKSVFDALKLHFPDKKIITIFEPHTFSWRNAGAKRWYKDIFKTSKKVIILPPPSHGQDTHDQMSFSQIVKEVKKNHRETYGAKNVKEALIIIKKETKKDDIIVLMSSGSLLGLTSSVPKLMEKMFPR